MAKRKTPKVKDLRPKNITKEELKTAKDITKKMTEISYTLGRLEQEKHEILHVYANVKKTLSELGEQFKKTYGTENIDIITGEIKYNDNGTNNETNS
tara:strand:+ start:137 stop:427 length:291 start_codon:yes stop_codon:yes gene_type:complete